MQTLLSEYKKNRSIKTYDDLTDKDIDKISKAYNIDNILNKTKKRDLLQNKTYGTYENKFNKHNWQKVNKIKANTNAEISKMLNTNNTYNRKNIILKYFHLYITYRFKQLLIEFIIKYLNNEYIKIKINDQNINVNNLNTLYNSQNISSKIRQTIDYIIRYIKEYSYISYQIDNKNFTIKTFDRNYKFTTDIQSSLLKFINELKLFL